jgi:hypothetical protein
VIGRRGFLKGILGGVAAAAAPAIFIPSTRTVIDMNPGALPPDDASSFIGSLRHFDLFTSNRHRQPLRYGSIARYSTTSVDAILTETLKEMKFVQAEWMVLPELPHRVPRLHGALHQPVVRWTTKENPT